MKNDAYTDLLKDYDKDALAKRRDIELELQGDLAQVLNTEAGQRVTWWLLSLTGVFLPSYTGNSDTYFNEGRRAIGLELVHRIVQARPGLFERMIGTGVTESN